MREAGPFALPRNGGRRSVPVASPLTPAVARNYGRSGLASAGKAVVSEEKRSNVAAAPIQGTGGAELPIESRR